MSGALSDGLSCRKYGGGYFAGIVLNLRGLTEIEGVVERIRTLAGVPPSNGSPNTSSMNLGRYQARIACESRILFGRRAR